MKTWPQWSSSAWLRDTTSRCPSVGSACCVLQQARAALSIHLQASLSKRAKACAYVISSETSSRLAQRGSGPVKVAVDEELAYVLVAFGHAPCRHKAHFARL